MDESIKMQLRESYSMQRIDEEFEEAGKRLAELEKAEKELGETQLLLIEEQERNQRLIQRLAEVERERQQRDIEQQIKAVEYCYKNIPDLADSDYVKLKRRAEQLRQQLNGDNQ